jgi:hypothetical protein
MPRIGQAGEKLLELTLTEYTPNTATSISVTGRGYTAVTNLDANTGYIYIGGSNLTTTKYMIRLVPGDVFVFNHERGISLYILNSVTGEKCEVTTWA